MPPDRQADAFAPRTSLHGHIYRPRPNGLETLKTAHLSQENRRELLSGHVPMDVLTRAPERRLWRGELRTARSVVTGLRLRKRGRAPPTHRLSFAKSRRTLVCELRAGVGRCPKSAALRGGATTFC